MKPSQSPQSLELVAYAVTSAVSAFAASVVSEREREYAEAKREVSAYTNAIKKLKEMNLPKVLDPSGLGKMLALFELEDRLRDVTNRQRAAKASVESGVRALAQARDAQMEAHANLVQGRIHIVTQGKKSVEVIIRVGGQSVTRHLRPSVSGYTGQAWDKAMIVDYPRDLESKVTALEQVEHQGQIISMLMAEPDLTKAA